MSEPVYPFLLVDVPPELAEVAAEQLFELGADGVEQRDAHTLHRSSTPDAITLVASFATEEEAQEALAAFDGELNPRIERVIGDQWRDAWKEHFHPFRLTPHVVVRPPWEPAPPELAADAIVLELEPGRAFGTGLHASTALLSRALDARAGALAGKPVLDVGCGSGILSLVALALGASNALCIDIDADSIEVTRENARRCGMADRVVASTDDLDTVQGQWPVVLANIQADVLIPLAPELRQRVAPGGLLLLSGILDGQDAAVVAAYDGFRCDERVVEGEWVALILQRER